MAGLAAARLVFRANPGEAGGDERLGGGSRRVEVAEGAIPTVGGGGDERQSRLAADETPRQQVARRRRQCRIAARREGKVEAGEPERPPVGERDLAAFVDRDGLNRPRRRAADRRRRPGREPERQRRSGDDDAGAGAGAPTGEMRWSGFHARGASPLRDGF